MRRLSHLLSPFFCALLGCPVQGSQSIVQNSNPGISACGTSSGTTCVFSPSTTVAGHTLVAYLGFVKGNTITVPGNWTLDANSLGAYSGSSYASQFAYCVKCPSTSSVSFTNSVSDNWVCGWFFEVSSSAGPGWPAYDVSGNNNSSASSATWAGPALTLNGTDDVIFAGVRTGPNDPTSVSGYTFQGNCSADARYGVAYHVNISSGAAATWTASGANTNWIANAEAFCDSGSGGCFNPAGFPQIARSGWPRPLSFSPTNWLVVGFFRNFLELSGFSEKTFPEYLPAGGSPAGAERRSGR
jgi:hypothetical protein